MKTVVLSDTHLSKKFYPRKFEYLASIIQDADRVIIAGDFWDGFLISFDDFIASEWQKLFPLLLEKQAIYLYGNHDRAEWCDERTSLFSVEQAMEKTLSMHDTTYYIAHGHTVFVSFEDKWPIVNRRTVLKIGSNIDRLHKLVWGKQFFKEGSSINTPMSTWANEHLPDGQILVCGHSHYPEMNLANKMVNAGYIGLGYASHVVIDSSSPRLVVESY